MRDVSAERDITSVCVYGSSHAGGREWDKASWELGRAVAARGWQLIYGGGSAGLMGRAADGAASLDGPVAGATLEWLVPREGEALARSSVVYVESLRDRKEWMESRADAFVVLPGGVGTMEELFEVISLKQLKLHNRPVVVFNPDGYWNPLILQLTRAVEHFGYQDVHGLFEVAVTVGDCVEVLSRRLAMPESPRRIPWERHS